MNAIGRLARQNRECLNNNKGNVFLQVNEYILQDASHKMIR